MLSGQQRTKKIIDNHPFREGAGHPVDALFCADRSGAKKPLCGIGHDSFFHCVGEMEICWAAGVFEIQWKVRGEENGKACDLMDTEG